MQLFFFYKTECPCDRNMYVYHGYYLLVDAFFNSIEVSP